MVRIRNAQFNPSANAAFGEDDSVPARSSALGRLSASSLDPSSHELPVGLSPGTLQFDPTLGGKYPQNANITATGPAPVAPTKSKTTTYLLIGGGALLAVGIGAYFYARNR